MGENGEKEKKWVKMVKMVVLNKNDVSCTKNK